MSEKPNECLHCAIGEAVQAWNAAYHPDQPLPEARRLINALAVTLGDVIAGAPEDIEAVMFVYAMEALLGRLSILAERDANGEPVASGAVH